MTKPVDAHGRASACSLGRSKNPRFLVIANILDDSKIRLDNNIAEQHLRLIALGRKNFLFVGHDEAGRNLATLQTLVSTCLANGVNPQRYLTDVLIAVQRLDELLPWNWRPPPKTH